MTLFHVTKRACSLIFRCVFPVPLLFLLIFFSGGLSLLRAAPGPGDGTGGRKVILLGFDGVDYGIARKFMEEGALPNLKALTEQGAFLPLRTANPAQSPVSWACIVSGTNPGKTNIGGFIRRNFQGGRVTPQLATIEENYDHNKHQVPYSEFSWLSPEAKTPLTALFCAGFFLLGLIVLKLLLRLNVLVSLGGSLVLAAGALYCGISFFSMLPEAVPFPYNLEQGEFFWNILARNGVHTIGLYAPGAYPVVAEKNADVFGGLGVPDINGSTGTWYVYSSEAFTFYDISTNTGGKVIRMNDEGNGRLTGKVYGPTNFYRMEQFEKQLAELKRRQQNAKLTEAEKEAARKRYEEVDQAFGTWKDQENQRKAVLDLTAVPDYDKHVMKVNLGGQEQTVKEGEWSRWFKVKFKLSPFLRIPALVRLRLIKCADEEVRFFVPAIDISPMGTPPFLRISSPPDYSTMLADRTGGPFETVGWSCITHGLKDEEIPEDVFLEDIEFTMNCRRRLFRNQLGRKDWRVFFEVFYTPDRVEHMMYRLYDEQHPQYDPQLAQREMPFFGRTIKMKDAILEIYKAMDQTVGEVLDRIEAGEFGEDVVLMVVSDHGFAPFYYCMGVNNFLVEKGFLALKPDASGKPRTVKDLVDSGMDNYLSYVDWSKTKAYSLGLGKIFINLKGREPEGVVTPGEYDSVCDALIKELQAFKDPNTGDPVIRRVYKREEIFSGDYWKEGNTTFRFYLPDGRKITENRYTEGFADLYLGFASKYRVSWQTSLGGLEESVIVPNAQKWSGDHVSVDPDLVPGVFFCNRKVREGAKPSVLDIAPTVLALCGVPVPDFMDGRPLPVE